MYFFTPIDSRYSVQKDTVHNDTPQKYIVSHKYRRLPRTLHPCLIVGADKTDGRLVAENIGVVVENSQRGRSASSPFSLLGIRIGSRIVDWNLFA